jgi:hypothetical protein
MRSTVYVFVLVLAAVAPSTAMKSHQENFTESCELVWKASIGVAKTQDYRIISVSKEEQIISLAVGGAWWGERIISLSLTPGGEHGGCAISVQSRYSGLQHSDGPDLIARIHIQLDSEDVDANSKAFKKLKACLSGYNPNQTKCEEKFRKEISQSAPPSH